MQPHEMVSVSFVESHNIVIQLILLGGHLRPAVHSQLSRLIEEFNEADAVAVAEFEHAHLKAIEDLVKHHDIDCEFRRCKSFDVYTDPDAAARARADYLSFKQRGVARAVFDDNLEWHDQEVAEKV